MKKFLNHPDDFVQECMAGFSQAHADLVVLQEAPLVVRRKAPKSAGVAVISGGGSGHEPLDVGFVGTGMLDAACPGLVFTAPSPSQIVSAAQQVAGNAGVILLVKNYAGDIKSFESAMDMLDMPVGWVLVNDDVSVSSLSAGRRGIAGTVFVQKIVGAAAESQLPLEQCKRLGDRANQCTATMAAALTNCSVPGAAATFEIGADEMEVGVGLHGEPGSLRVPTASADEIAATLLDPVCQDLALRSGSQVLLMTNGMGGTPLSELYLLHGNAMAHLAARGVTVARSLVGNFSTSLESAGASLSVSVLDDELLRLWDAPVHTAALRW